MLKYMSSFHAVVVATLAANGESREELFAGRINGAVNQDSGELPIFA